jgi:hypothetical protein
MLFRRFTSLHRISLTVIIICLSFLWLACGSGSKQTESNADSVQTEIKNEDAVLEAENTVWDDSLKKYFTPAQVVKIKQASSEFRQIKTAADLAKFYQVALDTVRNIVDKRIMLLDPMEYSGDNRPDVHWKWFNSYFPVLKGAVLCSECDYSAHINVVPLMEKAKQTAEKEDDLFFDLALATYAYGIKAPIEVYDGKGGPGDNQGEWETNIGCDVCFANMLGSGYYSMIIQKLDAAASARSLFGKVMDHYLDFTVTNVISDHYYHDKAKVLNEADQLLKSTSLSKEQREKLTQARGKINAGEGIQFGCGSEECTWEY